MGRKVSKELRHHLRSIEEEKDTIYALFFTPKPGTADINTGFFCNPWCVHLFGNPKDKPELIDHAIQTFEANHNVGSWNEIAIEYKVNSLYYP